MEFGKKIAKPKKLKQLSQIALAEATGIFIDSIFKHERRNVTSTGSTKCIVDASGFSLVSINLVMVKDKKYQIGWKRLLR